MNGHQLKSTDDAEFLTSHSHHEETIPRYPAQANEEGISRFSRLHQHDPNMFQEKLDVIDSMVEKHDTDTTIAIHDKLEETSQYPEVAAVTELTDDPNTPAGTFRAWFLGLFFVVVGSAMNLIFSLREPSISISSLVIQLVAYPCGLGMAKLLPKREWNILGYRFTLNPGPFSKKEHCLVVIMANVTFGGGVSYATSTIEAQRGFYNINKGFGFAILYTLATQMTGLGLAGICRRFLVYPATMIWPMILPNAALFHTLHDGKIRLDPASTNGWSIPRFRFFYIIVLAGLLWYPLGPGYLFQALSVVAWITWIKPQNVIVNQIFGGFHGYSIGAPFTIFTLDWTMIVGFLGSPLVVPWMAIANTMVGLVIFTWCVSLGISYSGMWYTDHLPISDSNSYANTATRYDVRKILAPDLTLDMAKYKEYSQIYLTPTFALQYGLSFASIISVISHTWLNHGKEIVSRTKAAKTQPKDIHMRMMDKYKEVPQWWFFVMLVIMMGVGLASLLPYDMQLPAWGYFLAISMSLFFLVPIGMITAMTNIGIGLNVITELIISYMLPGRPMAMMAFKTLGYITMSQAITYSMDQKLAIYMKVPFRTIFWAQLWASLISSFVQIGTLTWMFDTIKDLCSSEQKHHFTCPHGRVFFQASVIWGVIGPQRMFGNGSIYTGLHWFWLVGAITPVIAWLLVKKFPRSFLRYIHVPIIFGGTGMIPPAVPMNYIMWGIVGYVFNKAIRSKARGWWLSYNYILSAALDTGMAFGTILVFFCLQLPGIEAPVWWGNTVGTGTLDAKNKAIRRPLANGQKFGPSVGSW